MSEFYSRGFCGEVRRLSKQERRWFPRADLVKIDPNLESPEDSFATKFYEHTIAHLLFPDNFINIVGSRCDKSWLQKIAELLPIYTPFIYDRNFRIYSQLAQVNSNHAVFSAHMQQDYRGTKVPCDCEICHEHVAFHTAYDLRKKAESISARTTEYGIFVPYNDPSDYCITKEGNIVFFEVEGFLPRKLITRLKLTGVRTEPENRAIELIRRYEVLTHQENNK